MNYGNYDDEGRRSFGGGYARDGGAGTYGGSAADLERMNNYEGDMFAGSFDQIYRDQTGNFRYGSDDYASNTYAQVIRAEYGDYKSRFQPYEKKLMALADSEQLLDDQLSKITANGSKRYKQAQASSAIMDQRYNTQTTQRQQNYSNTQSDSQRGLAISQAKNMSRLASEDRRVGILSGAGSSRQTMNNLGG